MESQLPSLRLLNNQLRQPDFHLVEQQNQALLQQLHLVLVLVSLHDIMPWVSHVLLENTNFFAGKSIKMQPGCTCMMKSDCVSRRLRSLAAYSSSSTLISLCRWSIVTVKLDFLFLWSPYIVKLEGTTNGVRQRHGQTKQASAKKLLFHLPLPKCALRLFQCRVELKLFFLFKLCVCIRLYADNCSSSSLEQWE